MKKEHYVDPEEARFRARHPKFDFDTYIDKLRRRLAHGSIYEVVVAELRDHAHEHSRDLIAEFNSQENHDIGIKHTLLEILAEAKVAEAFPLFVEHLKSPDFQLRFWAEVGLVKLDTKESRRVLFEHTHKPDKSNSVAPE